MTCFLQQRTHCSEIKYSRMSLHTNSYRTGQKVEKSVINQSILKISALETIMASCLHSQLPRQYTNRGRRIGNVLSFLLLLPCRNFDLEILAIKKTLLNLLFEEDQLQKSSILSDSKSAVE